MMKDADFTPHGPHRNEFIKAMGKHELAMEQVWSSHAQEQAEGVAPMGEIGMPNGMFNQLKNGQNVKLEEVRIMAGSDHQPPFIHQRVVISNLSDRTKEVDAMVHQLRDNGNGTYYMEFEKANDE